MKNSESFENELKVVLQQICIVESWKYAELWIPDGDILRYSSTQYMVSQELEIFKEESKGFTFAKGAGLPGRVWMSCEPEWIEDISLEPAIYYRSHIAKQVGLKAALGVPIISSQEVIAVLCFYNDRAQPENEKMVAEVSDEFQSLMIKYSIC